MYIGSENKLWKIVFNIIFIHTETHTKNVPCEVEMSGVLETQFSLRRMYICFNNFNRIIFYIYLKTEKSWYRIFFGYSTRKKNEGNLQEKKRKKEKEEWK